MLYVVAVGLQVSPDSVGSCLLYLAKQEVPARVFQVLHQKRPTVLLHWDAYGTDILIGRAEPLRITERGQRWTPQPI